MHPHTQTMPHLSRPVLNAGYLNIILHLLAQPELLPSLSKTQDLCCIFTWLRDIISNTVIESLSLCAERLVYFGDLLEYTWAHRTKRNKAFKVCTWANPSHDFLSFQFLMREVELYTWPWNQIWMHFTLGQYTMNSNSHSFHSVSQQYWSNPRLNWVCWLTLLILFFNSIEAILDLTGFACS